MMFENFYLVGGYRFPANLGSKAETGIEIQVSRKSIADEQLDDYVLTGKSLLDLPSDNPAYLSVKKDFESRRLYVNPRRLQLSHSSD